MKGYSGYGKATNNKIYVSDREEDLQEISGKVFPLHQTSLENLRELSPHLSRGWKIVDLRRKIPNA